MLADFTHSSLSMSVCVYIDDLVEALYFTNQLLLLTPDDKHIMEYKLYIEDQLKDIPMPKLNEDTRIKVFET